MRLKEFGLGLPEASREDGKWFRLQVRAVTSLYERCFPGIPAGRGRKVLVECVPLPLPGVVNLLGVLCQQVEFALDSFRELDVLGRRAMALETLHRGVKLVAESERWPLEPFEIARNGVLKLNFVNEWTWPKAPVLSPGRKWRASVSCSMDNEAFRGTLVVTTHESQIVAQALAVTEEPSEFLFVPHLGSVRWDGENHVSLRDQSGAVTVGLELDEDARSWKPVVPE